MRLLVDERGQGTVEAAVALPVVFLLLLLLLQPAIVLYDRVVMEGAAAEACRLRATSAADDVDEDYVRRRLSAIPQADLFHVHEPTCSWDIAFDGDAASEQVEVSIATKLRPLPLLDAAAALLGLLDGDGLLTVAVRCEAPTQPPWAWDSPAGTDPAQWIGAWCDE